MHTNSTKGQSSDLLHLTDSFLVINFNVMNYADKNTTYFQILELRIIPRYQWMWAWKLSQICHCEYWCIQVDDIRLLTMVLKTFKNIFVTARKRSCEKVIFSQGLSVHPWASDLGPTPSPATDIWWSLLEICSSNLFI